MEGICEDWLPGCHGFFGSGSGLVGYPGHRLGNQSTQAPAPPTVVGADGTAISSVVVTNDNSNISFTINTTEPMATYIFYEVELQIAGQPVGDTSLTNNPYTAPNVGISTGVNSLLDTYFNYMQGGYDSYTWSARLEPYRRHLAFAAGGTGDYFRHVNGSAQPTGAERREQFSVRRRLVLHQPHRTIRVWRLGQHGLSRRRRIVPSSPISGRTIMTPRRDASSTFNSGASLYTVTAVPEPAPLGCSARSGLMLGIVADERPNRTLLRGQFCSARISVPGTMGTNCVSDIPSDTQYFLRPLVVSCPANRPNSRCLS